MRTGMMVFAMTATGVLGGVVGGLLAGGSPAPGRTAPTVALPAPPPGTQGKAWEDISNRVAALEGNLTANTQETTRLREALEGERKESAALRDKLAALESSGDLGSGSFAGHPGRLHFGGSEDGAHSTLGLPQVAFAMPERFKKASELRAMTEEERWGKARTALGLTSFQEEELKAALKERNEGMKEAMKVTTAESTSEDGSSSQAVTIAMPDMEKVHEARKKYDDRVAQALNADQRKTWRNDGYEGALGGGGGGMHFISSSIEVEEAPAGK